MKPFFSFSVLVHYSCASFEFLHCFSQQKKINFEINLDHTLFSKIKSIRKGIQGKGPVVFKKYVSIAMNYVIDSKVQ